MCFQDELTNALATMRVDHELTIKPLNGIKNPLMEKRGKKKNKTEASSARS